VKLRRAVGVELAERRQKPRRHQFVDSVLAAIPVEPYDLEIAKVHAALLAHTQREGRARGAHDLLIAATARARSRMVVTADSRGFHDLPQVAVRVLR
jgi:tRNA(fMet)-specific endonuclease VapC